jgi:hypothetical protein
MMGLEDKRKWFLAKAKEAEEKAAISSNSETQEIWLQIAKNYQDLARLVGKSKR